VKVTRLAHGVPVGGELDYLDEGTLSAAIRQRTLLLSALAPDVFRKVETHRFLARPSSPSDGGSDGKEGGRKVALFIYRICRQVDPAFLDSGAAWL
jgi:hypothetical protein